MDLIGIHNLGVCIILLTIVIYTLLMPLTIKQQKFSKMSAAMNPELHKHFRPGIWTAYRFKAPDHIHLWRMDCI